jgi:alkylation response protein AidB-like acyl-CoA dehydrogenase
MDYGYSEAEQRFRQEVRAFLEAEWGGESLLGPLAPGRSKERERAFRKRLGEKGWLSLGWPEEFGGTPTTLMQKCIISDELNRAGAPYVLYIVNVIGPLIIKYGTDEAKRDILPRIRSGEVNFTLGFTEPETGSDLASLRAKATPHGDGYVVNGQKLYGHPDEGDIMFLAVRTDPEAPLRRGISVLLCDTNLPGFSKVEMPTLSDHYVGATFYDDVFVPRSRLLGEENRGWDYIREALDLDRTAGIPYRHLHALFARLVDHIKSDERLLHDPWVRDRVGQLAVELEGASLLSEMNAARIAAGDRLRTEASVLKTFYSELEGRLAQFGMEVLGPEAVAKDGVSELHSAFNTVYRQTVAATIVGGSSEIQRNIIAIQGLGLPR